ncbi:hypothetical protein K438DRAFT_1961273 [Mycena galopus ATCC 62051]|nr:hypothetical protein K438DRAFT_1961273 [Mycena galopus ATCC 62051]
MGEPSAASKNVNQRIQIIVDGLEQKSEIREQLPGLQSLLSDYLSTDREVTSEDFHRRLLEVFRRSPHDTTYEGCLAQLRPDQRARVEQFVDGKPLEDVSKGFEFQVGPSIGVKEHLELMATSNAVHISSNAPIRVKGLGSIEELKEADGIFHEFAMSLAKLFAPCLVKKDGLKVDNVTVYRDAQFLNWGRTNAFLPDYTCVPSTVAGIQHIVKYAKENDMGVRCAGFRHSWSPIFGRDKQILISLLPLHEVEIIPNLTALALPESAPNELQTIEIVKGTPRTKGNVLVRVGVSTTNERLRRWCVQNKQWSYSINVIMVEMTIGGTNGPICHGAGIKHGTLSDLVRKVEYVDCNGQFRVVDDPEHLKAAAGCFGLMGVITHLTLEFQPMTYALMQPQKLPVVRAVPPPDDMSDEEIPLALRISRTPEEKAQDVAAFEAQTTMRYCEWFWFPLADMCWVNCWDDTTDATGVIDYPNDAQIFFMFVSQFAMNVIQYAPVLDELTSAVKLQEAAVTLLSRVAMLVLPVWDKPVKTYLTDALHFQRGIQNVRVLDVEVEMPLVARADDANKPDLGRVRRAWWDAILVAYRHTDTCPQRMPLEMRIMGGSEVIMAPQRGNHLGTCAIEVLTLESAKDLWLPYAEEILAKWMSYRDAQGRPLKTRPHWAKQWADLKVDGKPWVERMKSEYKDEVVEFRKTLSDIGKAHGWTLADLKRRFSNDFFDSFYFEHV